MYSQLINLNCFYLLYILLCTQIVFGQDKVRYPLFGNKPEYTRSPLKLQKCLVNNFGFLHDLYLPNTIMAHNESTHFRLEDPCHRSRNPPCHSSCPQDRKQSYTVSTDPAKNEIMMSFTPGGFLRINNSFFHRGDFCISQFVDDKVYVEACRPKCDGVYQNRICVPKCCSADKVIDINRKSCRYSLEHIWKPMVYKSEDVQVCGEKKASFKFHHTMYNPICPGDHAPLKYLLRSYVGLDTNLDETLYPRVRFRMFQDGSVILKGIQDKNWIKIEKGQYCLDGVQNYGSRTYNYSGDPLDQILIACSTDPSGPTVPENKVTVLGILYCVLLFAGTPFLLVTAIVYLLLWGKQNIHGWTLFSHTLAMLLNYMGQAITNTVTRVYDSNDTATSTCKIIGIFNHYFIFSSFCWMTVINYDLWSMFRHLQSTIGRSRGVKRFMVYSMIAWGIPFIVVLISVILDTEYGIYSETGDTCEHDHIIVPLYGFKTCFMVEEARPYYIFYPIGTLIMINLLLAGLTFYNMRKHKQSAKMVSKKSTKHKRKFSMWSKLFVVMGVAYASEVVVWRLKEKDGTLPWYLVFPDVIGLFQTIAIFILFACQPKIINQLNEMYPSLKPFLLKILQLPCYTSSSQSSEAPAVQLK